MSCHRVRRALLWMTRFEEFGPDSELHLDHLAGCRACRDEIGCDRELVRQLRAALAARVDGMEPSPAVWDQVRVLAQQPERRRFRWPWRRLGDALGAARSMAAMAGTGLALVLALNTQVVTVTLSPSDAPTPGVQSQRTSGVPSAWDRLPLSGAAAGGGGGTTLNLTAQPDPEGLLVNVDTGAVAASLAQPAEQEPAPAPASKAVFVMTLPLAPEPPPAVAGHDAASEEPEPAVPAPPAAGDPT